MIASFRLALISFTALKNFVFPFLIVCCIINKNEGNVSLFYVIEIQVKVRIRKLLTASSRTIL